MSDKAQKLAEVFLDYLNAQESACVNCKRQIAELYNVAEPTQQTALSEQAFSILNFTEHKGEKLSEFGTAEAKNNDEKAWKAAFKILEQNGSTINKRFHAAGFVYSYWLYDSRIFRQKLKNPA